MGTASGKRQSKLNLSPLLSHKVLGFISLWPLLLPTSVMTYLPAYWDRGKKMANQRANGAANSSVYNL